jgi:Kef-type K+ transport system membrane component KefB
MIPMNLLIYIGIALILGFLLGKTTYWLRLTAIVGYITAGIILGPVMNIIMEENLSSYTMTLIVDMTLGLVGFIIGIGFTKGFLRRFGKMAIAIAIIQSTVTFAVIMIVSTIFTRDLNLSLILGVIGLATAPAGTVAAIHFVRGRGHLSRMTIAVVGIDDGIAIIYFVFVLAFVKFMMSGELPMYELISIPFIEIGGAIIIGIIYGVILAYIGKTIKHREDIFIVTIGLLLLCIGTCEIVKASSILACMILGIIFINIAPKIGRITHSTVEAILPPVYVVFFAIAGLELSLQFDSLIKFGIMGTIGIIIVYIITRIIGKISGAHVAGKSLHTSEAIKKYMGFALLSQAGVAIGLAIFASNELSELSGGEKLGALVITIVTLTTIFFEIIGPLGVKYALTKAGEAHEPRT